jgi:hypothetical protein
VRFATREAPCAPHQGRNARSATREAPCASQQGTHRALRTKGATRAPQQGKHRALRNRTPLPGQGGVGEGRAGDDTSARSGLPRSARRHGELVGGGRERGHRAQHGLWRSGGICRERRLWRSGRENRPAIAQSLRDIPGKIAIVQSRLAATFRTRALRKRGVVFEKLRPVGRDECCAVGNVGTVRSMGRGVPGPGVDCRQSNVGPVGCTTEIAEAQRDRTHRGSQKARDRAHPSRRRRMGPPRLSEQARASEALPDWIVANGRRN